MLKRHFCRNRLTTSGAFNLLYLKSLTDVAFLSRDHESAHFSHPGDTKISAAFLGAVYNGGHDEYF